jgi:hypothetical protein
LGRTIAGTRLEVLLIVEQEERDAILRKGGKPMNHADLTLIVLGAQGMLVWRLPFLSGGMARHGCRFARGSGGMDSFGEGSV